MLSTSLSACLQAARITSGSGVTPVQSVKAAVPCWTSISIPSSTRHPAARACLTSGVVGPYTRSITAVRWSKCVPSESGDTARWPIPSGVELTIRSLLSIACRASELCSATVFAEIASLPTRA